MNALIRETTTRALIDELKSRNYVVSMTKKITVDELLNVVSV